MHRITYTIPRYMGHSIVSCGTFFDNLLLTDIKIVEYYQSYHKMRTTFNMSLKNSVKGLTLGMGDSPIGRSSKVSIISETR